MFVIFTCLESFAFKHFSSLNAWSKDGALPNFPVFISFLGNQLIKEKNVKFNAYFLTNLEIEKNNIQ